MSEITLQMVMADPDRLPALPEVVWDLMDYLQRPEVDVGQVAYRIARDPALAAKFCVLPTLLFTAYRDR